MKTDSFPKLLGEAMAILLGPSDEQFVISLTRQLGHLELLSDAVDRSVAQFDVARSSATAKQLVASSVIDGYVAVDEVISLVALELARGRISEHVAASVIAELGRPAFQNASSRSLQLLEVSQFVLHEAAESSRPVDDDDLLRREFVLWREGQ